MMKKNILFIQGGGNGGYEADAKLAASLRQALGAAYDVHYPQLLSDEALPDFGWPQQIGKEISQSNGEVILVGHSLGASMILKYFSESGIKNKIRGIFLIATPYWQGEEEWVQGLKLQEDFASKLPEDMPVFLYHCRDDEEVPFAHLALYRQKLPQAAVREIASGGHQLNNDLTVVAKDIKSL
jgi:predicted alpha/beta hydrolase family esterase